MLSVRYAGQNAYSAGKTSGVLRVCTSRANMGYVLAHCGGSDFPLNKLRDVQQEREGTSLNYFKVFLNYIKQFSQSILLYLDLSRSILDYLGISWSISLHLGAS